MDKETMMEMELLEQALLDGAEAWEYDPGRKILTGFFDDPDSQIVAAHYWLDWDGEEGLYWICTQDYAQDGCTVTGAARLGHSRIEA